MLCPPVPASVVIRIDSGLMLNHVVFLFIVKSVYSLDSFGLPHIHHGTEKADVWGDVWVVHLRKGIDASLFAAEVGYQNLGEILGFARHFLLHKVEHDGIALARHLTLGLLEDSRVIWAEQQFDKIRVKRGIYTRKKITSGMPFTGEKPHLLIL